MLQHQRQQRDGARPGIRVHLPLLGAALAIGRDVGMDPKGVEAPGRLQTPEFRTDLIDQGRGQGQLQRCVDDQQVDGQPRQQSRRRA